jgi:DNA processing protein
MTLHNMPQGANLPAPMPSKVAPIVIDEELQALLRLVFTPGVGRGTARILLAQCDSAQNVFASTAGGTLPRTLAEGAVSSALLQALATPPTDLDTVIQGVTRWLGEGPIPRALIALGDARYPKALLETADPPVLLYAMGGMHLLQRPAVAIVGSRNATAQGMDNARAHARVLSQRGYTVVSGLALGIDAAAHEGALTGPGSTIAVVGTGIDRIYPSKNAALARQIAEVGLVLSEYPLGTPPLAENFPQRNRIIAGLAQGTLVVEAALRSGSLITAQLASECGREVFAMPGSVHAPQSHGCHALIKQGAKLVESTQDLLDELTQSHGAPTWSSPMEGASTHEGQGSPPHRDQPVLDAMGFDPVTLDLVLDRTGLSASSAQAKLLELELEGLVQRLPGGQFARRTAV